MVTIKEMCRTCVLESEDTSRWIQTVILEKFVEQSKCLLLNAHVPIVRFITEHHDPALVVSPDALLTLLLAKKTEIVSDRVREVTDVPVE